MKEKTLSAVIKEKSNLSLKEEEVIEIEVPIIDLVKIKQAAVIVGMTEPEYIKHASTSKARQLSIVKPEGPDMGAGEA